MESQEARKSLYLKLTSPRGNEQWVSALRTKVTSPLTYCHIVPKVISPITSHLTGESAWIFNSTLLSMREDNNPGYSPPLLCSVNILLPREGTLIPRDFNSSYGQNIGAAG